MNSSRVQDPAWYEALSIRERAALLNATEANPGEVDRDLARSRASRWSSQTPFELPEVLERRLRRDGLDNELWLRLLGEPASTLRDCCSEPPHWLKGLIDALSDRSEVPLVSQLLPKELTDHRVAFLDPFSQLVHRARRQLRRGLDEQVEQFPGAPFKASNLEGGLVLYLIQQLVVLVSPVMVLELHVARHQGRLSGDSPAEQFSSFTERIRRPEVALGILQEYPVLARRVSTTTEQWATTSLELARRLCEDLPALTEAFFDSEHPGEVVELMTGLGDRHRGGRSVVTIRFSSGRRVVYKPRNLGIDAGFQSFLRWCNSILEDTPFRTLGIVNRESHGWVEFVTHSECESVEEVARFFKRQGRFLALLHLLQATDFHFENLIAVGEHPVLIDLESLIHPQLDPDLPAWLDTLGTEIFNASVLRVGLLPMRMFQTAQAEGVDVSGLGAQEGQLTPQAIPMWENAGTSEMHLTRKKVPFTSGVHQVRLQGAAVDGVEFLGSLLEGFESMYLALQNERTALLAEEGPLAPLTDCEVRVIVRPSRAYALLLQESTHPDLMRNALDRDRFFDRLWLDLENRPYLERLIAFEQNALREGDVPIFSTRPRSRSLFSGSGQQIVDLLEQPSLELVHARIRHLSAEDLKLQKRLIRGAMATLSPEKARFTSFVTGWNHESVADEAGSLLTMANEIGQRIADAAILRDGEVAWFGYRRLGQYVWSQAPAALDLFDGLPGIALFLSYLDHVSGKDRWRVLAETTVRTLRDQLKHHRNSLSLIGGFEGWGGALYTLSHLSALWQRPELISDAEAICALLPELIAKDEVYDVIGGSAGCIGGLLALHRVAPQSSALDLAARCGLRLLDKATEAEGGLGWITPVCPRPLSGFSHGAAGVAWALARLAAATGEPFFQEGARKAVTFEQSLYSEAAGNWRDPRFDPTAEDSLESDGDADGFMVAWCYGAAGIGLSRLHCLDFLPAEAVRSQISAAMETTLAQGFGSNHSLNQGDLGNLELFVEAERRFPSDFSVPLEEARQKVIRGLAATGPHCATPLGVEAPGLMTGLSGIGYGLLRLAAPERVPSPLVLEPPLPA